MFNPVNYCNNLPAYAKVTHLPSGRKAEIIPTPNLQGEKLVIAFLSDKDNSSDSMIVHPSSLKLLSEKEGDFVSRKRFSHDGERERENTRKKKGNDFDAGDRIEVIRRVKPLDKA